jgi:adenosylcobinamide-phosphate synthase
MIDLCIAVLIDWIIGDPYWFPHPIIYIGKLIKFLENIGRKLFKEHKAIKLYGGAIVLIVCAVTFLIPFFILHFTKAIPWLYHTLNIFILWTTLAARSLHKEGIKVYHSLVKNDIEDARLKLSYIVGRDTTSLGENDIIRADIETIAENTSDGIIAPLFFAAIGGAPLAMLYKGVNTMDSMLGYMNVKYRHIGFFPAKTDDVFNYIPARISGFLLCIAAPIVKGNIIESIKIMIRDRKNHKSPNCAYPEAAVAGAMRVQLGGTNVYFGEVMVKPTIGDKLQKLNRNHIRDTVKLMYSSEVVFMVMYVLVMLIIK